jgi:ABC-type nickel/cobalt efflux system permease component RcnA
MPHQEALLGIVGPFLGGIIAGLLHTVLSPDHLATIITLSACQGTKAFWFGIRWGLGHLGGMAIIGATFTLLRAGTDFEAYEHYMDYMVGVVLVVMGVHFLFRAEKYFDAEWVPKQATCACHAHLLTPATEKDRLLPKQLNGHSHGHSDDHIHDHKNCTNHDHGHSHGHSIDKATGQGGQTEQTRAWGAVLVGFLQGLACPAGVVGIIFLKAYKPVEIVAFIAVFFVTATLAMGALAMAYGVLTQRFVQSAAIARGIYYTSCSLSVILGLAWLALNATGSLESVLGHDHEHGGHEHVMLRGQLHQHGGPAVAGNEHEHEHHHQHNLMMAALSLMA